jgi:sugar/nucleoside kinase (ribokinase family)
MRSSDICLHGNLILDKVYGINNFRSNDSNECIDSYESPGAIANMVRALSKLNPSLRLAVDSSVGDDESGRYIKRWFRHFKELRMATVDLLLTESDLNTSEALILSDVEKGTRTSIVRWGACSAIDSLRNVDARWHHILYLDKLPNLDIESLKELSKTSIISADLCGTEYSKDQRKKVISALGHVDYIFASSEEARSLTQMLNDHSSTRELGKMVKKYAIVHTPNGSSFSSGVNNDVNEVYCDEKIDGPLNVLGAGDNFASAFIASSFFDNNVLERTIRKNLEFAHRHATSFVRQQSNR